MLFFDRDAGRAVYPGAWELTTPEKVAFVPKGTPEILPAVYDDLVFLRPHHIQSWQNFFLSGITQGGRVDEAVFARWLNKTAKRNLVWAIEDLLEEKCKPDMAGVEVEYLGLLKTSTPDKLSQEDRLQLQSFEVPPDAFHALSQKQASTYAAIWNMSDTTQVMVARVMDFQCLFHSSNGFPHCTSSVEIVERNGGNIDEWALRAFADLPRDNALTPEQQLQVVVKNSEQNPDIIESVRLPLLHLRNYKIIDAVIRRTQMYFDEGFPRNRS